MPLFDKDNPITTTQGAATAWARAYFNYYSSGNLNPLPRQQTLALDLKSAFNPYLNGGGRSLFLAALAKFWIGTQTIVPVGFVTVFVPSGSIEIDVSENASQREQARAIANLIHQLTVSSAKALDSVSGALVPVS